MALGSMLVFISISLLFGLMFLWVYLRCKNEIAKLNKLKKQGKETTSLNSKFSFWHKHPNSVLDIEYEFKDDEGIVQNVYKEIGFKIPDLTVNNAPKNISILYLPSKGKISFPKEYIDSRISLLERTIQGVGLVIILCVATCFVVSFVA